MFFWWFAKKNCKTFHVVNLVWIFLHPKISKHLRVVNLLWAVNLFSRPWHYSSVILWEAIALVTRDITMLWQYIGVTLTVHGSYIDFTLVLHWQYICFIAYQSRTSLCIIVYNMFATSYQAGVKMWYLGNLIIKHQREKCYKNSKQCVRSTNQSLTQMIFASQHHITWLWHNKSLNQRVFLDLFLWTGNLFWQQLDLLRFIKWTHLQFKCLRTIKQKK